MKSKALKKAAALLVCAAILCAGVVTAFAAGKTYYVPEAAEMQITLPEDMTAVTRESNANDKYFSLFGIDYNTNKEQFESSNIYLQGMNSSSSLTVTVTMTETEESNNIVNYNLLEGDKINEIAKNFINQSEYTSCTIDQSESNIIWLDFNTRVANSGSTIEAYQANTVFDGKSINVTLQRNGGNVSEDDYEIFYSIVSSVEFHKSFFSNPLLPFFLIGGAVLLIVIIVLIVVIAKAAKRRRKKTKNDKILEELAGKYTTNKGSRTYSDDSGVEPSSDTDVESVPEDKGYQLDDIHSDSEHSFSVDDGERKYSDADIDAMLGENGETGNFTQALPESEEEPEEEKDDTIDKSDSVSEFFEDEPESEQTESGEQSEPEEVEQTEPEQVEPEQTEQIETEEALESEEEQPLILASPTTRKFDFPKKDKKSDEELNIVEAESALPEEAEEAEEAVEETAGPETEAVEPADEAGFEDDEPEEESEKSTDLRDEIKKALLNFESDDENEDEQFNNDEVLVREEAKRTKFRDSNDYFEEAPKKVMGVISSKEIRDAEEYDVIGEMERRADEVKKEPPQKGEAVKDTLKKAGTGVKSFFTHCGYFAKNVRREIKRKKAEKKRQQYEEDRKRRARERAERQRQQTENGGLVQVHKRTDRKPSSQQRRPSSQQRRPSSQNRRPSSQQRRPSSQQRRSNTQTRRPSSHNRGGRPPRNI